MISPDEFLAYLCKIEGGAVAVDLLKIGTTLRPAASSSSSKGSGGQNAASNGAAAKFSGTAKLRLALDMEDCLDRFYGGYYSGNMVILPPPALSPAHRNLFSQAPFYF